MNQNHQGTPDESNSDNIASLDPRLPKAIEEGTYGEGWELRREWARPPCKNHGFALDVLGGGTMEQ